MKKNVKLLVTIAVLATALSCTSCKAEKTTEVSSTEAVQDETAPKEAEADTKEAEEINVSNEQASQSCEGIGQSTMPTPEEMELMKSYTTENWADLSQDEKWTAVQTTVRMWEVVDNYINYDIDSILQDIDFQMNTYIKNKTDISFFETMCDIYNIDISKY